jgi:CRP/FNR family transcriptional regulator
MSNDTPEYSSIFSSVFEPDLLAELEAKSMLMNVRGGETIMRIGSPVRAVPLVISGIIKVSRVNDEGQEIL